MKATFDPAQRLDLYFRKFRDGSKTFIFRNEDGSAYSLEGLEFEIRGIEAALDALDNELEITVDGEANPRSDSDFWELICTTFGKTWLCGTAFFTEALPAIINDVENITINLEGEPVIITISDAGNSAGVNYFRGVYDASDDTYPEEGGSGPDGEIEAGNRFYFSPGGNFEGVPWPAKTLAEALIDNPGQDANNWRLI
jgi:hypothetical protein